AASSADIVLWSPHSDTDIAALPALLSQVALENIHRQSQQWVLLSSSTIYGEGVFACGDCGRVDEYRRSSEHLTQKRWEAYCPLSGEMRMRQPVSETDPIRPVSDQGRTSAAIEAILQEYAVRHAMPLLILRVFNPYWPQPSFWEGGGNDPLAAAVQ